MALVTGCREVTIDNTIYTVGFRVLCRLLFARLCLGPFGPKRSCFPFRPVQGWPLPPNHSLIYKHMPNMLGGVRDVNSNAVNLSYRSAAKNYDTLGGYVDREKQIKTYGTSYMGSSSRFSCGALRIGPSMLCHLKKKRKTLAIMPRSPRAPPPRCAALWQISSNAPPVNRISTPE